MTQLATYPMRVRFNTDDKTAVSPEGSSSFSVWRGNDVSFAVAAYFKALPLDMGNVASLKLQLKDKQNPTAAALAEVDLIAADITAVITDEDWTAETVQHATFDFTAAQMNQSLSDSATKLFWLVLSGLTDAGKSITYGAALLEIKEDNAGFADAPPIPAENYYTQAEVDALLAVAVATGTKALTSHTLLRAVSTISMAQNTIRSCYIGGVEERFIWNAGVEADDDANYLRSDDYNDLTNANTWKRIS
jgi:hypothetical protein